MAKTRVPQPEEILKRYKPTLQVLVAALLEGAKHARAYADWVDEPINRTLSPAHVRIGAQRFLNKQDGSIKATDEEVEFEPEYLPNLGLSVAVERIRFRILRSDNGTLPAPGPSKKRQQFYAQQGSLFPEDKKNDEATKDLPRANLVLHWNTDDEYNLTRVSLAYPTGGRLKNNSVKAEWDEVIWRRGTDLSAGTQVEAKADELDIHLDKPEEETGTGG
jgi:hypothetical protein